MIDGQTKIKGPYIFFILAVLGLILYSNVFKGEFVSDDYLYIVDNPAVVAAPTITNLWSSFNSRFLVGLTFVLNYAIGGKDPLGYHLFNIFVHILASCLVYIFVRLTFRTPHLKAHPLSKKADTVAAVSAVIFLCHPVQTETAAFVSQRAESMSAICYLLTLIGYVRYRLESQTKFLVISIAVMLVGIFVKEGIVTAPLILVAYEVFFLSSWREIRERWFKEFWPYFGLLILLFLITLMRQEASYPNLKEQIASGGFSWRYFLTEINVLRTYLGIFIFPVNLNHDYHYPIAQSIFEGQVLISLALLTGLMMLGVFLFKRNRLVSFCIAWYFITIADKVAIVCLVHRSLLFDHWLYLPMVGFSMMVPLVIHAISKDEKGVRGLVTAIVVIFCLMTYQRNKVWQTEIGLYEDVLQKSPLKAEPHFGAANAYLRKGQTDKAVNHLKEAIKLKPDFFRAYSNLGTVYFQQGRYDLALNTFQQAYRIDPSHPFVNNNLAYFYFVTGKCKQAIKYYHKSIALQGDYADAYFYMGQCYAQTSDVKAAKESLNRAVVLYKKWNDLIGVKEAEDMLQNLN